MEFKRFDKNDAVRVSEIICGCFKRANRRDYTSKAIEELIIKQNAEKLFSWTEYAHIYVFGRNERLTACGAIVKYEEGKTVRTVLLTFVPEEMRGQKAGRRILEVLEQDELFKGARNIEVPAAVTAIEFYKIMGFEQQENIKAEGFNTEPDIQKERCLRRA